MEIPVIKAFICAYSMRGPAILMGILGIVTTISLSIITIDISPLVKGALQGEDGATLTVVNTIVVIQAMLLVIKSLLDIACVYAIYKENTYLVKKYLIFWIVFAVIFIICFLKTLFHMDAVYIIAQVSFLLSNLYVIIIIRSYVVVSERHADDG